MQAPSAAGHRSVDRLRGTLCVTLLAVATTACQDNATTAPTVPPTSARNAKTATAAVPSVKTDSLAVRDSIQLSPPTASKNDNGPVAWTSSATAIATISKDGLARAIAPGTATMRVTRRNQLVDSVFVVVRGPVAPTPAPTPVPTPAPAPAPVTVSSAPAGSPAAVLAFMAASNVGSVSTVQGKGGAFAKFESDFASGSTYQWGVDSTGQNANFYDRAMIYYVQWARTGNATYLDRANKLAIHARNYLSAVPDPGYSTLPKPYYPQAYQMMIDGVALHALVTGDSVSRYTVAQVADAMANPNGYWSFVAGNPGDAEGDSRTSARVIQAVLDAYLLKVPSPAGYDYASRLRDLESRILTTQSADGSYVWPNQCGFDKPYMTGMVNDALIRYYTSFEADSRIPTSVKNAVDFLWTNNWVASSSQFQYLGGNCTNPSSGGDTTPTANLNNMMSSGFAFVAKQTGDATYYTKADAIFAGGVYGTWLAGSKEFNQEYTTAFRYLSLRF